MTPLNQTLEIIDNLKEKIRQEIKKNEEALRI